MENLKPADLISILNDLTSYEHHILYYGNNTQQELTALLDKVHKTPPTLKPVPPLVKFQEQERQIQMYMSLIMI